MEQTQGPYAAARQPYLTADRNEMQLKEALEASNAFCRGVES